MRILFVGVFNKPWSSNIPIAQELRDENHYVKIFDYRSISLKFRKIKFPYYIKLINYLIHKSINMHFLPDKLKDFKFYLIGNRGMNKLLFSEVSKNKYDLILFAKVNTINYKLIPKINKFSNTFYYFMDPLGVAYNIGAYRYASLSTWSSASTRVMNKLFKKKGVNSYYILEGYNEKIFKSGEENKHKQIDVIFVGSIDSTRERFINYLRDNKIKVICFGLRWENKPIYLERLVKEYRRSKIILNFPRQDSGFSDRVFQALGTGSFLLTKFCSDLERVFKKEIHLDWFKTPEECLKLVEFYLENDGIREKIS